MTVGNVPRQQNRENDISAEKVSHFQQCPTFVELLRSLIRSKVRQTQDGRATSARHTLSTKRG